MGLSEIDRAFLQMLLEEEIVSPSCLSKACMNASSIIEVYERIADEVNNTKLIATSLRFNHDFAYIPECTISNGVFKDYGILKMLEMAMGYGAVPLVRSEFGLFVGVVRFWPFDDARLKFACDAESVQWLTMGIGEFLSALKKYKIIPDSPDKK